MQHISLFNGIGGFQLAAEWMGWNNLASCEIDQFCNRVTKYHFPNCIQHHDIRTTDFTIYKGRTDILTGGFPCQPYSVAGLQKGTEDHRHLWPEMLRAIKEIEPYGIVGENVPGLVNWNGGLVFEQVQADLENQGYQVIPFLLPAASVNAPHKRERIWFIAINPDRKYMRNSNKGEGVGIGINMERNELLQTGRQENADKFKTTSQLIADTESFRYEQSGDSRKRRSGLKNDNSNDNRTNANPNSDKRCKGRSSKKGPETPTGHISTQYSGYSESTWQNFPTQSAICNGNDGISAKLDGITFSKWRNESLKAGGNAIVPQVALQIFKAIEQYEILLKTP